MVGQHSNCSGLAELIIYLDLHDGNEDTGKKKTHGIAEFSSLHTLRSRGEPTHNPYLCRPMSRPFRALPASFE